MKKLRKLKWALHAGGETRSLFLIGALASA
jgi:hypothetical protein